MTGKYLIYSYGEAMEDVDAVPGSDFHATSHDLAAAMVECEKLAKAACTEECEWIGEIRETKISCYSYMEPSGVQMFYCVTYIGALPFIE